MDSLATLKSWSLYRTSILILIGALVFSVVRRLFKDRKSVPTGAKSLPGPKGIWTYLPVALQADDR
jgi:hypothetical protein